MKKWTVQHRIFSVEIFNKNNLVVSVERCTKQRFGINGIQIVPSWNKT